MPTQCTTKPLLFEGHGHRRVMAAFDGGPITSDAGLLLLRRVEQRLSRFDEVADCFTDLNFPLTSRAAVLATPFRMQGMPKDRNLQGSFFGISTCRTGLGA